MDGMGTRHIGRYEILHELGHGGMATVFLARDPSFDRQVAIKVLPTQFTHDPQFLTRFRREARVIAGLEHAYVVPVYDYGEEAGRPFLVMRYMAGGSLADRMKTGPMPLEEVVPIVNRLAEALDEAHRQSIVHRDFKPANVMFDSRGLAYLSDFGIAKMLASQGAESLTGTGIIGTPAYMSPEQAVGDRPLDSRSDIYSFGIVVYEMLTGRPPFRADTPMRLLFKHVTEPVPQLPAHELDELALPSDLNAILARALAKEPDDRFQTALAMTTPLTRLTQRGVARQGFPAVQASPVDAQLYSGTAPTLRRSAPTSRTGAAISLRGVVGGVVVTGAAIGLVALGVWLGAGLMSKGGARTATPGGTWAVTAESIPTLAALATNPPAVVTLGSGATIIPVTLTSTRSAVVTPTATPTQTTTMTATATITVTVTATRTRAIPVVPPTATWTPAPPPSPTETPQPPPSPQNPPEPSPTDTPAQ